MISKINEKCGANLNPDLEAFIRIERLQGNPSSDYFSFDAKVTDLEYVGQSTVYTIECFDQELKHVEKNLTDIQYDVDDIINLNINPKDIMQFGEEM